MNFFYFVDTPVTNWWDNGNHQIAFCRGNKGFIAINNEPDIPLNEFLMVLQNYQGNTYICLK